MNASVIKVVVQSGVVAFAKRDCCRCFGGVGEAVELGELNRAACLSDVAEDAAGADGGELLIVTDQPDAGASAACNDTRGRV